MFPLEHGRALAASVDGATFLQLDGTGHELTPSDFDRIIEAIQKHTSRSAVL